MITKAEKDYLQTIDPKKKVSIFPFDPKGETLGKEIVKQIKSHFPKLEVFFMGSVALGISGQKDIDIYAIARAQDFEKYLPVFIRLLGKPTKPVASAKNAFIEWNLQKGGYETQVYLTEPPERQIKVFEILKSNKKLLKEYESIKLSFDGKSYKEYQRAKYAFYNRILKTKSI